MSEGNVSCFFHVCQAADDCRKLDVFLSFYILHALIPIGCCKYRWQKYSSEMLRRVVWKMAYGD